MHAYYELIPDTHLVSAKTPRTRYSDPMTTDTPHEQALHRKLTHAAAIFSSGRFAEAEVLFKELAAEIPERPDVLSRLGHLALLSNRMDEAIEYLAGALHLDARSLNTWNLLADAYYRKGEFGSAAYCYDRIKRRELAATLAAMAELPPHRLEGVNDTISLPWIAADPLPVVRAEINGAPANLVLDTGAGDLVLDQDFAVSAGVYLGEREQRRFAGGLAASVWYGHAKTLNLGEVSLHDLLVQVLPLDPVFAPYFASLPIHGILGTAVFSRFSTTLDYRARVLRLGPLGRPQEKRDGMRFWIAGSHYIMACGKVSESLQSLMFLDTGLAGAAFAVPRSTADAARITSIADTLQTGHGGGGEVQGRPLWLDRVCLGSTCRENVEGILLEDFPLELQFGFRIGGLVAHDFFRSSALILDFGKMSLTVA